jgi:hypothetical protein
MAARLNRNHSEQVLERIRLSQLVNLLQKNALGTLRAAKTGESYELSKSRQASAQFLVSRKMAQAVAPQDLNVNGHLTVLMDDPTQRPEGMNGYHRKPLEREAD